MKNHFASFVYIMLATATLIFNGCQKIIDYEVIKINPLEEKVTASVNGRVTDENGKPASDVSVQSGNNITVTDINGVFRFSNIQLSKNAGFVLVEKNGYFRSGRTIFTNAGVVNNIEIKLIPKTERGTFPVSEGGIINIENGAAVNFESNGIVIKSNKTPYSGTVTVFGAYLNPQDANLALIMPGNLTGLSTNNEQKILQTYGMIAVELEGSNGEKLDLAPGIQATITIPVPTGLQANAPASIPLWYFNDTIGIWKEEGNAVQQNQAYVGKVSHLSFWNCDLANDFINLKVTIKNQNQQLLAGYRVALKNTQNDSEANGYTDSLGTVNGPVPTGAPLKMIVYNKCNSELYTQTIGPFTAAIDLGVVTITIPATARVNIAGTVTKCNQALVTNGVVDILVDGLSYRAEVSQGNYSITIDRCSAIPTNLNAIATDLDANEQSSVTSVNVTSGNYTTDISACGISNEEFIRCNIGNDTFNFIPSGDSLTVYTRTDSNITTEITAQRKQMDSLNFQFITFKFNGPETPGTYSTNFILLFRGSPSYLEYLIDNPMSIIITEYGERGEFVAGNFTGEMRERFTNVVVPATCSFRIRRF